MLQTALRLGREAADRFNLISQQLQPCWCVGVWREDIDDAATAAELGGIFHGIDAAIAVGNQPSGEALEIDRVANPQRSRAPCEFSLVRRRLNQGADGCEQEAWRRFALKLL